MPGGEECGALECGEDCGALEGGEECGALEGGELKGGDPWCGDGVVGDGAGG